MRSPALGMIAVATLLSCAAPQVAPDRYYVLDSVARAPAIGQPLDVMLEDFDAFGVVAEQRILFRRPEAGGALEQYRQQFWIEPPARMLTDGLLATLRSGLGQAQVHGRNSRMRADWVLRPRLRQLEQRLDVDGAPQAHVAIEFIVTNESNEPRFVLVFDETRATQDASPQAFAQAVGELAAQANLRLLDRLAQDFRE